MRTESSPPPAFHLAVPGLPSLTDRMLPGWVYALVSEMPPARFPLLAGCLGSALANGRRVTIIVATSPEFFLERMVALGQSAVMEALSSGQLVLFSIRENFSKNIFRFGTEYFARELDHFGVPEDSLLIFDQADELLGLHDVSLALEQMEALKGWFDAQKATALLVFNRVPVASTALGTLRGLMDNLAGIVRITGEREGLELMFDYWQSPEGTVAAKHFPLLTQESGLYRISARELPTTVALPEQSLEDSEPHFFYMDPDLSGLAKALPGIWRHVESLVGMLHATRGLHSPTIILSFQRNTELRPLAETVHTLRLTLGRRARIVVREKEASLRYQNEALLLRLGTNLVVHRDVAPTRLPLLLDSLRGQIFDRDVDINFDAALASAVPSGLKGYLPPARFVREVESVLSRSSVLSIPCSLVVGTPARDTSPEDVVRRVNMARPGDLVTADHDYCYLFMSGCPEANVLVAVERVLGQSVGAAFDETRFVIPHHEMKSELNSLARLAERNDLPDHSELVRNEPVRPPPGSVGNIVGNTSPTIFPEPAAMPVISATTAVDPLPGTESASSAPLTPTISSIATDIILSAPIIAEPKAPAPLPSARPVENSPSPKSIFAPLPSKTNEPGEELLPPSIAPVEPETLPAQAGAVVTQPVSAPASPPPATQNNRPPGLHFRYGDSSKEISTYGRANVPRASRVVSGTPK